MNESNHRVFALIDLVALGESELRQPKRSLPKLRETSVIGRHFWLCCQALFVNSLDCSER